jgi:hypothetical protein
MDARGTPVTQPRLDSVEYRWTPEKSPTGPMTIIISKVEQRIVVLRNGVEIGRSAAIIHDDDPGSHVIVLTVSSDGKRHWIYVGIPGHDEDQGKELDQDTMNRVRMPASFYEAVKAELHPGDTILVTQSSVGADTGKKITILDSVVPKPD